MLQQKEGVNQERGKQEVQETRDSAWEEGKGNLQMMTRWHPRGSRATGETGNKSRLGEVRASARDSPTGWKWWNIGHTCENWGIWITRKNLGCKKTVVNSCRKGSTAFLNFEWNLHSYSKVKTSKIDLYYNTERIPYAEGKLIHFFTVGTQQINV